MMFKSLPEASDEMEEGVEGESIVNAPENEKATPKENILKAYKLWKRSWTQLLNVTLCNHYSTQLVTFHPLPDIPC